MGDHHHPNTTQITRHTVSSSSSSSSLLRNLRFHVSNSGQLFGVLTLLITWSILLLLTGLTVIGIILGLILFAPLIIITSPIWVPLFTVLFLVTAMFLSTCGFGLVVLAVMTWMYRYFKGHHPPGSDRVKDRSGYLHTKMIDAAPGA